MASKNGSAAVSERHHDFDAGAEEPKEPEIGPTFTLKGQTFRCFADPPGIYLAELIAASDKGFSVRIDVALALIRGVIVPEDEVAFDAVMRAKGRVVNGAMLGEIANWMVGEYTGFPTTPPSA